MEGHIYHMYLFVKNCCWLSLLSVSFSGSLEDSMIVGGNKDAVHSFFKGLS